MVNVTISGIFSGMYCFNQSVLSRVISGLAFICMALPAPGQEIVMDSLYNELKKQNRLEVRVDLMNALANRYYDIKVSDSLFHYGQEALALSKQLNYTEGKLAAYTVLSSGYWYVSDYERALNYANRGRELGLTTGNTHYLADNVIAMGLVSSVTGDYEGAFGHYFEALRIAEEQENLITQARVLNNIAYTYIATGEDAQAVEPLKKAIGLNYILKNDTRMAAYHNNLGVAHKNLNDYDTAFQNLNTTLDYAQKTNYLPQIAVVPSSSGETHLQKGEPYQALSYA